MRSTKKSNKNRNKQNLIRDKSNLGKLSNASLGLWLEGASLARNYIPLHESPEVKAGVEKVAEIVSLMTIHLMENGKTGDERIKNALSKKIDIYPNKYMNRQLFINWIVQEMLLYGNAIVLPVMNTNNKKHYLEDLVPIPKSRRAINELKSGYGYEVEINNYTYEDDEVLNFRINPKIDKPWIGNSQEVILRDFINNLGQANLTTKDFMENKMLPNVIVKVSGLTGDMDSEEGRSQLENRFLSRSKSGQPWIIPSELMQIDQIKPTTLQDIAIDKTIKINKESVASILGIPTFLLGVGTFNKEEYNNFIKTKVSVISKAIEQELTKKLLFHEKWYFKFNTASLLSYDLPELASVFSDLYTKGIVTGNEVRDKLGISTMEGLDELIILENYIPKEKLGDQSKLNQKGGSNGKSIQKH